MEAKRRLAETETRRRVAIQNTLTAAEAVTLFATVLSIVREEVSDRAVLNRISRRLTALIAPPSSTSDEPYIEQG